MSEPVLTEQDLANLLRVPGKTVEALLAKTDIPRFKVEGKVRFLSHQVLAWLERKTGPSGGDIMPLEEAPAPPPPKTSVRVARVTHLPPARAPDHPWVADEALAALSEGASDPGKNLDRLKLRDALLELNDVLLPALGRFSAGRLHPHYDEKSRTSPWRLDLGGTARITSISIAWGAGENSAPQFTDRPHIEVELARGELRICLDVMGKSVNPALTDAELDQLYDAGFAVELEGTEPRVFAKLYPMPQPAPPVAAIAHTLEQDLERLVPLWARVVPRHGG